LTPFENHRHHSRIEQQLHAFSFLNQSRPAIDQPSQFFSPITDEIITTPFS
jgi:hypothetical protein